MIWLGLAIVIATFYAIIKNYETRMVLFISGAVMAILGGGLAGAFESFVKTMVEGGLVPTICTVMGFSYVMDCTGCTKHLVTFLTNLLKKVKILLVPGAVLATFAINIALPSAAGAAAAVGALLIPTLIGTGVHPALAASAVFLGTWGSSMSPGLMFNPQIAKMAQVDVMTVIATFSAQTTAAAFVAALLLAVIAHIKKEGPGSQHSGEAIDDKDKFHVNYIWAITPVVPLVLLILGSKQVHMIPEFSVPQAMVIGTIIGMLITRFNVSEATKKFFKGNGDGFADIVCLMAAAAMFTQGMTAIGITGALIDVMKNSQQIAQVASAFGPFIIGVVSGSGNAAALAFNGAVTPHAAQFGYGIIELGSMAQIGAGLGRTMSPVAGAGIICAKIAGVNPMELAKRNAIPTIVATLIVMFTLL
ncbi:MAG TPA: C4-dicarboxylate transporter DcuC [Negativicutes bacterium]|nr:C4-dicarboxylate transporter DcuC [Negativicutes bacterium]